MIGHKAAGRGNADRDGHVPLHGRASELLRICGETWYPRDLEEALCALPGVLQAAVVGAPDPAFGVRPVAFIQTAGALDAAALIAALRGMTGHDVSKLGLRVLDAMPMTPTGKIAKAELAAMARGAP